MKALEETLQTKDTGVDTLLIPRRPLCGAFPVITLGKKFLPANAQGIEVEILLAKPKDWNGKPGPSAAGGRMRPKENFYAFILPATELRKIPCNGAPLADVLSKPIPRRCPIRGIKFFK
jgi:hypothetical protein